MDSIRSSSLMVGYPFFVLSLSTDPFWLLGLLWRFYRYDVDGMGGSVDLDSREGWGNGIVINKGSLYDHLSSGLPKLIFVHSSSE